MDHLILVFIAYYENNTYIKDMIFIIIIFIEMNVNLTYLTKVQQVFRKWKMINGFKAKSEYHYFNKLSMFSRCIKIICQLPQPTPKFWGNFRSKALAIVII